ncbi:MULTISPECIES: DNA repair protein RecN [unclassified Psychrobacillus]|uniref:DNA repair protein RecN n=1 Tax=unclassified Psychrobacillus TaxID=2636677 RepID=UPI00146D484F|nr:MULTISPECIES: DNA repair protein RecN [unclassified Psychrobacillus]MCM3359905.1 DNA repair protein RecN [Psychrobacillus sp. MER TA 171]NME04385.1 DNA repair protein RecN [Psychrobacillus sp. BL-248-WT-3]
MLKELSIKNFAIIDELSVGFDEGLTVLTGETGAGKSIIIDAVHLLCGGRGSQEFIRHGARKAELEGLFIITDPQHSVFKKMFDVGIDVDDETIILRRDLNDSGKSVCRVNGKLVTIGILREIGASLIDIHGQHESQELMDDKAHIHLLDQFAGEDLKVVKENYKELFHKYKKWKKELATLTENEQQIAHKIDLYTFQVEEIAEAQLKSGEEELLQNEKKKLLNFHKVFDKMSNSYEAILGESKGLDYIGTAMSDLMDIADVDDNMKELSESVSSAFYILQDAAHQLKNELDEMEYDSNQLLEVEERLATIQTLKRKYGSSIEEILEYKDQIQHSLSQLVNRDEQIQKMGEKIKQIEIDLQLEANELTVKRKIAAEKLSKAIMEQLKELYMEKATFSVMFHEQSNQTYNEDGLDDLSFYISTNVGEPLKALTKIASGGELSRMMLALKSIFSKHQGITSIIFDEVDTGVSGRVAQAIAEKIAGIATNSQVLCISHLSQVAAMADQHLLIRKEVTGNRTYTLLEEITDNKRAEELSRMMSGTEITTTTLKHSKELLKIANERKKILRNS